MPAVQPTSASPVRGTDPALPPPAWENHSARFSAEWDTDRVVITAHGELDLCIAHSTPLVLDLSELKFFGTAGFSALHLINVKCAGANLRWAVVPSKPVSRLLRICDPDHTLPLTNSVHAMPATYEDPDRLFQLIP
jgi:anti-anti-sigma regulatory factor